MPDKFDPYREALVMETRTIWPEEYADWDPKRKHQIEQQMHADPQQLSSITYFRTHTGFCRELHPTAEEIQKFSKG